MDDEAVAALLDASYRYTLAVTHDSGAATNLVQDAWVAVLRAGLRSPSRVYLFLAIRSRFVGQLRRQPRLVPTRQLDPEADGLAGASADGVSVDPSDGALVGLRHEALELRLRLRRQPLPAAAHRRTRGNGNDRSGGRGGSSGDSMTLIWHLLPLGSTLRRCVPNKPCL